MLEAANPLPVAEPDDSQPDQEYGKAKTDEVPAKLLWKLVEDCQEPGQAKLTPTEGAMLQVLLSHRNQTVSKETLLEWLWQGGKYLNENTLNVNISRLRAKLTPLKLDRAIRTERGVGYRLVTADE